LKIKNRINKVINWIEYFEDFLCKHSNLVSLISGVICSVLYLKGFFIDVHSAMTNVITLSSIMFGIIGLILSLYSYLEGTKLWERKDKFFSELDESIENMLKRSLKYNILVLLISMAISVIKPFRSVKIKVVICFFGIYFFANMVINTFYLLIATIDFVIGSKRYAANIKKNTPVK
jgi:hypothetical protein